MPIQIGFATSDLHKGFAFIITAIIDSLFKYPLVETLGNENKRIIFLISKYTLSTLNSLNSYKVHPPRQTMGFETDPLYRSIHHPKIGWDEGIANPRLVLRSAIESLGPYLSVYSHCQNAEVRHQFKAALCTKAWSRTEHIYSTRQ